MKPVYGYLAVMKLLASAAGDRRLCGRHVRALNALASYVDPDGTCIVKMDTIAAGLGITRQALRTALASPQQAGYFHVDRRRRPSGQTAASLFKLNLELVAWGRACPVTEDHYQQAQRNAKWQSLPARSLPWKPSGCAAMETPRLRDHGTPQVAHKKPSVETRVQETLGAPGGQGQRGGNCLGLARRPSGRDQINLAMPIPGRGVSARVNEYNKDTAYRASRSLWSEWARLDPRLELYDRLGQEHKNVAERAQDIEGQDRGRGCKYMAGAVERATNGEIKARDILAGRYARTAT